MAQYKVLQDIEAEDKLLGPLTLRQFVYAIIVVVLGFVCFKLAPIAWYLTIPFLPPIVFFALLAAPFGRDQSSEVWLLGKIKYILFPRKRIWDQAGQHELVTITVPKKVEKHLTKDFDREEAKSRLKALANTMDTRGWVIKNLTTNSYNNSYMSGSSDRLLALETIPQEDEVAVKPSEDLLDANNTPLAQQMQSMVAQSQQQHRQAILQKMHSIAEAQETPSVSATKPAQPQPVKPQTKPQATVAPIKPQPIQKPQPKPMTPASSTDIMKPGKTQGSASTLHVKSSDKEDEAPGEVVISLH